MELPRGRIILNTLSSYLLTYQCLCLPHRLLSQEAEALVHAPARGKKCKKNSHPVYLSSTLKITSQNKLVHHTVTLNHKTYANFDNITIFILEQLFKQ